MHRSAVRWLLAIGLGCAVSSPALAQFGIANLSHGDGGVTRLRSGGLIAAAIGDSLIEGEEIATAGGRAEVTFLDGATVHLDRDTRIALTAGDAFRLLHGRASLRTGGYKEYVAETAAAKVFVPAGSLVEISVRAEADVLLQVISGVARIATPAAGSQRVGDYHTAYVSGPGQAPVVTRLASTPTDDFGRWTLARTVMATSTTLKGSDKDSGVSYAYYSSPPPSSYQPSYGGSYYQTPYYGSSYDSSYYPTPYYSMPYRSNVYHASRYNSYDNPYSYTYSYSYPSYRSPWQGRRGFDSPRPSHPIAMPPRASGAAGTSRGAIAVVPRR
jgi:hypothetical protein